MKKWIPIFIGLMFGLAACQKQAQEKPTAAAPAAPAPVQALPKEEADEMGMVVKAIQKFKLTSLKPECLMFMEAEKVPGGKLVIAEVREKHDAACGGDPSVAPRLFEIRVNKETGEVWVDVDESGIPTGGDFRSAGKI